MNCDVKNIVLIDDSPTICETYRSVLEKAGYAVTSFVSGTLFLKETLSFNPDLFLIDVFMPDMDGFELIAEIRKQ